MEQLHTCAKKMFTKQEIRLAMKQKREQLTNLYMVQASNTCADRVFSLPQYKEAATVFVYLAFQNEMSTLPIIEQSLRLNKKIAAPKVNGKNIDFYYFDSIESLIPGVWGIPEPPPIHKAALEDVLMVMPGIAFDKKRNRVGYGGGFYDRYLKDHNEIKTLAIAYDFQVLDDVPAEPFDQRPEIIVTNQTIIR